MDAEESFQCDQDEEYDPEDWASGGDATESPAGDHGADAADPDFSGFAKWAATGPTGELDRGITVGEARVFRGSLLKGKWERLLREVAEVLAVPADEAILLLRAHRWQAGVWWR